MDHAATFATPGFPACPVPADSLLPPPITGTGPGTSPAPTARAGLPFLPASVSSVRQRRTVAASRPCRICAERLRSCVMPLRRIRVRRCPCRGDSTPRTRASRTRTSAAASLCRAARPHVFAASKKPGTGPGSGYCDKAASRQNDQKLRRGPTRNDLSFSATRASAARPKFCVNLYWPETPSDALRSTWSSFS